MRTNLWDNSRRRRGFPSRPPGRAGCPRPAGLPACTATPGSCNAARTPQGTALSPWTTAPCRRPPTGFRWAHRSRPLSPGYTPTSSLEVTEVQKGQSRRKRPPYPPDLDFIFALRHESLCIYYTTGDTETRHPLTLKPAVHLDPSWSYGGTNRDRSPSTAAIPRGATGSLRGTGSTAPLGLVASDSPEPATSRCGSTHPSTAGSRAGSHPAPRPAHRPGKGATSREPLDTASTALRSPPHKMAAAAPQRPGRAAGRTIPGGRGGTNCGGPLGTQESGKPRPCPTARCTLSAGSRTAFSEPATAALPAAPPQAWGRWCGPVRGCASAIVAGSRRRPVPVGESGNGKAPASE